VISAREGKGHGGGKVVFYVGHRATSDGVKGIARYLSGRYFAHEVDGLLWSNGKSHIEQVGISFHQVRQHLGFMAFETGHELRFELQGALIEREPDRDEVTIDTFKAKQPAIEAVARMTRNELMAYGNLARY
jgi:hypothetical protein